MTHWFMSLSIARRTAVVYGAILFGWLFGLELPAQFRKIPILTLSGDVRAAVKWWHVVALLIAVFFIALWGHFAAGWRVRYLIATAVLILATVAVHALTK